MSVKIAQIQSPKGLIQFTKANEPRFQNYFTNAQSTMKKHVTRLKAYSELERIEPLSPEPLPARNFLDSTLILQRISQCTNQRFPHIPVQRITNKYQSLPSQHLQHFSSIKPEQTSNNQNMNTTHNKKQIRKPFYKIKIKTLEAGNR